MGLSQAWKTRNALAVMLTLASASAALASQGPGTGPGTASALTQAVMAIVVYGAVASIMGVGLARLLLRRF